MNLRRLIKEEVKRTLNEKRNSDVVEMFMTDSFPKNKRQKWGTANKMIEKMGNGWALVNYSTPIVYRSNDGTIYFNTDKYSKTTSKMQNEIRSHLDSYMDVVEVNERGIYYAIYDDK